MTAGPPVVRWSAVRASARRVTVPVNAERPAVGRALDGFNWTRGDEYYGCTGIATVMMHRASRALRSRRARAISCGHGSGGPAGS